MARLMSSCVTAHAFGSIGSLGREHPAGGGSAFVPVRRPFAEVGAFTPASLSPVGLGLALFSRRCSPKCGKV